MLVHSGKKDFQCHVCLKEFSQKQLVKRHMLAHTKVKRTKNVIYVAKVSL